MLYSKHTLFLLAFFTLNFFQNCSSGESESTDKASETTPKTTEPTVEVYAVTRENFRLRDKPSMTVAKKIGLLSYGDFLLYLDEKTTERTTVTLGMRTYDEPFYKVKDLGSDNTEGWMHGSGMLRIFKGGKSTFPNFDVLEDFGKKIGALPFKQLKSSQKALEYAEKSLATADAATADALYIILEDFLRRNEMEGSFYNMTEGVFEPTNKEWEQIFNGTFDMSKIAALKPLADAGYRLNTAEGALFPSLDYAKLARLFSPKVSEPMQTYLAMQVEEDSNRATEDAGIVLPLKDLADRAIAKEIFTKQNPNFPIKVVFSDAQWTQFLLLCGADNTPIYDWESKKVRPEVKENWAYILATYPDSDLAKLVKERKLGIAAEGNLVTDKAQEFCGSMAKRIW